VGPAVWVFEKFPLRGLCANAACFFGSCAAAFGGIRAAFADHGCDLVFVSSSFQEYATAKLEHAIGSFASAVTADFDAYIVMAGIIKQFIKGSESSFEALLSRLPREKTLVIEDNVPSYHCLYKDNRPGMREVMTYVLDEHKCQRVGFVSGPERSFGARERESVYFEEMDKRGLSREDRWFVRGKFQGNCSDIIEDYVSRNLDLEAIVCATDSLALEVYRALEAHGRHPGIDVLVTGHDDQPEAALAHPPLTTVQLDPFGVGYQAGVEAINIMYGRPQQQTTVSGRLIKRFSCGERVSDLANPFQRLVTADPFPTQDIAWEIFAHA